MNKPVRVFVITFLTMLLLMYFGCSVNSSTWDPLMWAGTIKESIVGFIFMAIIFSAALSVFYMMLFD